MMETRRRELAEAARKGVETPTSASDPPPSRKAMVPQSPEPKLPAPADKDGDASGAEDD